MSTRNGCLIAPSSFALPISPQVLRVGSAWADKESRLNLTGRAFTYIFLEVQPLVTVICCHQWNAYVRADYRDSAFNESQSHKPFGFYTSNCFFFGFCFNFNPRCFAVYTRHISNKIAMSAIAKTILSVRNMY